MFLVAVWCRTAFFGSSCSTYGVPFAPTFYQFKVLFNEHGILGLLQSVTPGSARTWGHESIQRKSHLRPIEDPGRRWSYTAYWRCTSGSAVPLGHFGEKLLFSFSSFLVVTAKEKQSSSQSRLEQRVCLSGTVWDYPRSTSVVTPLLNQIAGDPTMTEDQMLRCRSEPFTNPHGRRRRN